MSVVLFPRSHAGERQPGCFAFQLPNVKNEPTPIVLSGVDLATQAAVLAEIASFEATIAEGAKSINRIVTLLRPFMAENVR